MRLILFLGAGVSAPSGLPPAPQLTELILLASRSAACEQMQTFLNILAAYDTADIARPGLTPTPAGFTSSGAIYRGAQSTYEDIFFLCQEISLWNVGLSDNSLTTPFMECIERQAGPLLHGTSVEARLSDLAGLGRRACSFIESFVAETLRRKYRQGLDLIQELSICPDVDQLNIVTLNHDTLVEQFLSTNGLPFVDGFGEQDGDVRWFKDDLYDEVGFRVRILKLHGSVNWYSFLKDGRGRTAIFDGTDPASARDSLGTPLQVEFRAPRFLSGLNKAVAYQRAIFADIHFRFAELLRRCDRIVMSGYGWGDTVINFHLNTWFDRSRSNRVILLHENSRELCNHSLIMAAGYDAWVRSGQLICTEGYLCHTSLPDLRDRLFANGLDAAAQETSIDGDSEEDGEQT